MDASKAPGIKVESILLESISYRKVDMLLDLSRPYNVNINFANELSIASINSGRVISTIKVTEQTKGLFELTIAYSLNASVIPEEANLPIKDFLEQNAPAILYQFLREIVLSTTQKAGIPLILPPMNLTQFEEIPSSPHSATAKGAAEA